MGGPVFSEVVVIGYIFVADWIPEQYRVWRQSQSFSASGTSRVVSDWYRRVIYRERCMVPPPRTKILFSEWHAKMGDESFFNIGNIEYDGVLVVLGVENCHWAFYRNDMMVPRHEGMGELKCSYCNCCIKDQYLTIIEAVRDLVLEGLK